MISYEEQAVADLRSMVERIPRKFLEAEKAEMAQDAERYRWIRERLTIRPEQYMDGKWGQALTVRFGDARIDRPRPDPGVGFLDRNNFEQECANVDQKIDEARRALAPETTDGEKVK